MIYLLSYVYRTCMAPSRRKQLPEDAKNCCCLWRLVSGRNTYVVLMNPSNWQGTVNSVDPGPWFNIEMSSYQNRKSDCGDKTVVRSSYLHKGISYTGKMTSLYWIRALVDVAVNLKLLSSNTCSLRTYVHFLWNRSSVTENLWRWVNLSSDNGIMPSDNRALPGPMPPCGVTRPQWANIYGDKVATQTMDIWNLFLLCGYAAGHSGNQITQCGRGKLPPFRRRHIWMYFLEWKCMNFD